jgi:single-strand DNA-binding protein
MFEVKGTIHHIGQTELKGAKQFPIRLFVVKNEGNFVDYYPFELSGERTEMADGFEVGQEVQVSFHIRGREWQDKWFTSLSPFKIEPAGSEAPGQTMPPPPAPNAAPTTSDDYGDEDAPPF